MSDRAWHWTIGLIQLVIAGAAGCWLIYMDFTKSGLVIGAFGFGVAYVLTVVPFKLLDWATARRRLRR